MLAQRLAVAAVGIPLVLALVVAGGLPFCLALAALAVIGVYEFRNKAKGKGFGITEPLAALVAVGFVLAAYLRGEGLIPAENQADAVLGLLVLLLFGAMVVKIVRFHHDPGLPVIGDIGATLLAGIYVGAMLSMIVAMRELTATAGRSLPPVSGWNAPYGARLVLLLMLATWTCDSAAYFVGRSMGRRKLSPASPNKTVEGAVGGLVGAILAGLAFGAWFGLPVHLNIGFGLIAGVVGQAGDLGKSIMKRELGVKDFGGWLPGHGGMLDRFDSLLFNGPIAYLLVVLTR